MQQSLETLEVAPIVRALREHLETVRQNELKRIRRRQVSFRSEQRDAIEDLTRGIVTRILDGPVTALEAAEKEPAALLCIVPRIFNLGSD